MIRCISIHLLSKVSFVCSILIILYNNSNCQIVKPFNLISNFGSVDSAGFAWHVFTDSDFIYVIGNTNRTYFQPFTQPILARYDFEGNLVNFNSIIDSSSNDYMLLDELPIIIEPDGFSMMIDRMDILGSNYSKELIKFSKNNGGVLQKMRLPRPPNSNFNPTSGLYTKASDGHYTILGYIGDAANLYFSNLDSSFNTISQIVLPDIRQWDFAGYLKERADGSLILAGYSTDSTYWQPFLLHVSPTGVILEYKLAPKALRTRASGTFTVLRNVQGNWIFSSIMDTTSLGCQTCKREIPFVCAISPDFDSLLWVSYFSSPPYEDKERNVTFLLTEANDHSGYISSLNKSRGSSFITYLSKVSSEGDSLWIRRISPLGWENVESASMRIFQLVATPYNTFVGAGTVSNENGPNRPWIFQIDSLGCLVPGCDQSVAVEEILTGTSKDFKLYPNPVDDLLYISYQGINLTHSLFKINLMSTDGKMINTTSMLPIQHEQFILTIPQIAAGEYILNIESADRSYRQSEIIVKQE